MPGVKAGRMGYRLTYGIRGSPDDHAIQSHLRMQAAIEYTRSGCHAAGNEVTLIPPTTLCKWYTIRKALTSYYSITEKRTGQRNTSQQVIVC